MTRFRCLSRRVGGLLIVAAAMQLVIGELPAAATPLRQPSTQDSATLPVRIVIDAVTPTAPGPDDTVSVTGSLVNDGAATLTRVQARLRTGASALTRSQVDEYADAVGADAAELPTGRAVGGETSDVVVTDSLAPGAAVPFTLSAPIRQLGLRSAGAYLLAVEVLGSDPDTGRGRVGLQRTFVPYGGGIEYDASVEGAAPTRLVWLWPLVDQPRRAPDEVLVNDGLAEALRADAPLGGLPAAAGQAAVTWVADADLLETAAVMAQGYEVREGGQTRPGGGQAVARSWLTAVQAGIEGDEVMALGYADPDAAALQRDGLTNDLVDAVSRGPESLRRVLGRPVAGDVAWPIGGTADAATLDTLRIAGVRAAAVSEQMLPVTTDLSYTPTGRGSLRTLAGAIDGLVVDAGLADVLDDDLSAPGATALAVQRLLADTVTITAQRPSDQRTVLMAPPRRWRPPPAAAAQLVAAVSAAPWAQLTGASTLRAEPEPDVQREQVGPSPEDRAQALPEPYLDGVAELRGDLRTFAGVLTRPTETTDAYNASILRTESSAWRNQLAAGEALGAATETSLETLQSRVRVLVVPKATLASDAGALPVTIANELDQEVLVGLQLTPNNSARLQVTDPGTVSVPAGTNQQVDVQLHAVATGVTSVAVQLTTPDGVPYGEPAVVQVNATSIGAIGAAVTGGALAVLLLAAGVRVVQRVRHARRDGS